MTIISAFNLGVCPVVIGDLLLSGHERLGEELEIPIGGSIHDTFPVGSGWSVVGLRQKIAIVAPNCIIAWAGSYIGAKIVIRELQSLFFSGTPSYGDLRDYFEGLRPDIANLGVHFVGWINDREGLRRFNYDASLIERSPYLGEFAAAGSGARAFAEIAKRLPLDIICDAKGLTALERAVATSLMATGLMLQGELITQENLFNFFGGGYEIGALTDDCFSKIGDITYVFWFAVVSGGEVHLSAPQVAIKQDYVDDILLIRAIRTLQPVPESNQSRVSESLHVVLPVYRDVQNAELRSIVAPAMNSKFTCHIIFSQDGENRGSMTRIEHRANRLPESIRFESSAGHVLFSVNQGFVDDLKKSLAEGLAGR